jgi:hypothetical protein
MQAQQSKGSLHTRISTSLMDVPLSACCLLSYLALLLLMPIIAT